MGQMINLTADDGHRLSAYRAAPSGTPKAGLVVVQEIFGVNHHIQNVCDRFAADGYVALAPAIFDRVEPGITLGYTADDIERGRSIRGKVDIADMVRDVRTTLYLLWGGALFVLLIGCVNVANLVLVRSRARLKELATRVALREAVLAALRSE